MQRFFSGKAKARLTGLSALAGIGLIGLSVNRLPLHGAVTPSPQTATALQVPQLQSPVPVKVGAPEVGKASWYGEEFEGKTTANGESFDPKELTCAHRTLPLGSLVRVTNLRNHKTVTVRVNDRGPMSEALIMDLSYTAAQKIGIFGLGKVSVQRVRGTNVASDRMLRNQTANKPVVIASVDRFEPFPFLHRR